MQFNALGDMMREAREIPPLDHSLAVHRCLPSWVKGAARVSDELPESCLKPPPPGSGKAIPTPKEGTPPTIRDVLLYELLTQDVANTTTHFFEAWILTGVLYFMMCYPLALMFGRLERRMKSDPGR